MSIIEPDDFEFQKIKNLFEDEKVKITLNKNSTNNQKFVLKKFKIIKAFPICIREFELHRNLEHENIIKTFGLVQKKDFLAISMEFGEKGDFFSLIEQKSFSENLSRFFACQMLKALLYLKSVKIFHRDLKLENLLLSSKNTLKLADFGLSTKMTKSKKNRTLVGTKGYMSPEIYLKKKYDPEKNDIFAFGVILFTFVLGRPPFENAVKQDNHYRVFLNDKIQFWQYHSKLSGPISESFVIMINNLLDFNPENRFTFEQLSECYWMKKQVNAIQANEEIETFFN